MERLETISQHQKKIVFEKASEIADAITNAVQNNAEIVRITKSCDRLPFPMEEKAAINAWAHITGALMFACPIIAGAVDLLTDGDDRHSNGTLASILSVLQTAIVGYVNTKLEQ
jgi:hypothetical protein